MSRLDGCDSVRRAGTVALLATVLFITAVDATAQLTPEHVARVAWIEEPAMSPDGRWVAYIRSLPAGPGQATRGRARDLFLTLTAGGEPRLLVSAEHNPASPSWSPGAARLAFLRRSSHAAHIDRSTPCRQKAASHIRSPAHQPTFAPSGFLPTVAHSPTWPRNPFRTPSPIESGTGTTRSATASPASTSGSSWGTFPKVCRGQLRRPIGRSGTSPGHRTERRSLFR